MSYFQFTFSQFRSPAFKHSHTIASVLNTNNAEKCELRCSPPPTRTRPTYSHLHAHSQSTYNTAECLFLFYAYKYSKLWIFPFHCRQSKNVSRIEFLYLDSIKLNCTQDRRQKHNKPPIKQISIFKPLTVKSMRNCGRYALHPHHLSKSHYNIPLQPG